MNKDDETNLLLVGVFGFLAYMVFSITSKASTPPASNSSGSASIGPIGPTLNADGTPFISSSGNVNVDYGTDSSGW